MVLATELDSVGTCGLANGMRRLPEISVKASLQACVLSVGAMGIEATNLRAAGAVKRSTASRQPTFLMSSTVFVPLEFGRPRQAISRLRVRCLARSLPSHVHNHL